MTVPSPSVVANHDTLLHDRVAVVRGDLLEIAASLEHAHDADPACIRELRKLLATGCEHVDRIRSIRAAA